MGRRRVRQTKGVKRLWRDRVRENSVVKQFGPRNSHSQDNIVVQRVMIRNVLGLMRASETSGAALVSPSSSSSGGGVGGDVQVTNIPLVMVSESRRPSDVPPDSVAVPLVESSESIDNQSDPVRKYIVLPTFDFMLKNDDEAGATVRCHIDKWPDASCLMRGVTTQKINVDGQGASISDSGDNVEVSSVSYLTIPNTTASRRPSTADLVIEKLKVEKVEGGGLSIQGVSLASNCHVTLCVFGTFFLVAGLILSYISFSVDAPEDGRGSESGSNSQEKKKTNGEEGEGEEEEETSSVSQMRKIGPSFICIGLLMLILGISFYALAKKISRDEKARRRAISERQLNQLENSFNYAHATTSPMHTIAPAPHEQYPILSVRRNSWWVDPAPVENACPVNPEAKDFSAQCPSPHGDAQGFVSPPTISPVPSESRGELAEGYNDIACFPTPAVTKMNSDPGMLPTLTSVSQDQEGQGQGQSQPSSASQGRSYPGPVLSDNHPSSASVVPSIQVTAAQPTSVPKLPRLSRHCSTRMDSRPTTADSR